MPPEEADVVVVGAGIAGLTAAYRAHRAGRNVVVLEAEPHPGGRMRTTEWEGFRLDPGAQFFTGGDVYLLEMVRELGLDDEVKARVDGGLYFATLREGVIHPVDFLRVMSYLRWKGVSFRARMSMVKLLPYFLRRLRGNVYEPDQSPGRDDEDFEQFLRRRISAEMYEYWAHPTFQTNCSYAGPDLSRKALLALLAGHMGTKSYQFRQGMGTLPGALAEHVGVRLGAEVLGVRHEDQGATVRYRKDAGEHSIRARDIVVAVPGHRALGLLENPRPQWEQFLSRVRYPSVITQYHVFEAPEGFDPRTAPADGVMIPDPETGFTIAFVYFVKRDGDRWLAMTEPKAHSSDLSEDVETAAARSWADVERIYPELRGTRRASTHYAWEAKVPAFPTGYLDALARFRADPAEGPLWFCGDYLAGPGTGAALYTGWKAAERMLGGADREDSR